MPEIEYRFGTGEGDPNIHHSQANMDVDGDGVADGVALDFDGDGRVDDAVWDSDGDGVADTAVLDLDDDGRAEAEYSDPTGMGTWNEEGRGTGPDASAQPQPAPAGTGDYEPYGEGSATSSGPDTPEIPGLGTGSTGSDDGTDNRPDEDADGDTGPDDDTDGSELFDSLEDPPDVDRDSLGEWYQDLG